MYKKVLFLSLMMILTSCNNPSSSVDLPSENPSLTSEITSDTTSEIESSLIESSSEKLSSSEEAITSEETTTSQQPSTSINIEHDGYYQNIDLDAEGTHLLNSLSSLLNSTYIGRSYATAWSILGSADEDVDNSNNIIQIYSRYTRPKSEQNTGSNQDSWNREHVTTQAAMSCSKDNIGPCTDLHNLFASDSEVNSKRGNTKFGLNTNGTIVKDSKGRNTPARTGSVFDPNSEARGEVARVTLYMIVKWGFNTNVGGNFDTLLEWNRQYPPTLDREIKRNDAVFSSQNNRNPFIDYPYLADAIWA